MLWERSRSCERRDRGRLVVFGLPLFFAFEVLLPQNLKNSPQILLEVSQSNFIAIYKHITSSSPPCLLAVRVVKTFLFLQAIKNHTLKLR